MEANRRRLVPAVAPPASTLKHSPALSLSAGVRLPSHQPHSPAKGGDRDAHGPRARSISLLLSLHYPQPSSGRCHGCFTLVVDTTRQFCPQCGSGDTLKKVSYTVKEDGSIDVWINPKKVLSTKA